MSNHPTSLNIIFTVCVTITIGAPVDSNATKETKCLWSNLFKIGKSNRTIFGHHNDNIEGQTWYDYNGTQNNSDIRINCGSPAGFVEYDIGMYIVNHSFINFTNLIKSSFNNGEMIGWYWWAYNPINGENARNYSGNPIIELMPGGSANQVWISWLDTWANFVKNELILSNGNLIPMLVRLFHENLGSWFWWGQDHCTQKDYINAFNYTRWYLVEHHRLHNLLFVYAPNKPYQYYGNDYNELGTDRYPGNNNIDIVAFDGYDNYDTQYPYEMINSTKLIVQFAEENSKISAIGEFGFKKGIQNCNDSTWWMSNIYNPLFVKNIDNEYGLTSKISYLLTWWNQPYEWWIPIQNQTTFQSFVEFACVQKSAIMLADHLPDLYDC